MLKTESFRAQLLAAVPELARDPDRLLVFLKEGHINATAVPGRLSFEYNFQLTAIVTDYAGHPDALFVAVLGWIARNQPELLGNPERREQIRFEAEILSNTAVDIEISVPVSEAVSLRPRPDAPGMLDVKHFEEPAQEGTGFGPGRWEVWLRDEYLGAWDEPEAG
jgi:P2 phage tail completion protein R (GpR).